MLKVLFVDDNPNVLNSFKRALRTGRDHWQILTAQGAMEALDLFTRETIDLIISDLRMPEMDGVELLKRVKTISPSTMRIVITGDADPVLCERATLVAHQFIAKPIEPQELITVLNEIYNIGNLVNTEEIKRKILQIANLPSQPNLYQQLINELNKTDIQLDRISTVVSMDISMTAKILQLVNSAYFGLAREVTEVSQAIFYLGIETIRDLAFSVRLFSQFDESDIKNAGLGSLWDHSLRVATCSRAIVSSMTQDRKIASSAFTAGILHHIGKLIIGTSSIDFYNRMNRVGNTSPAQYLPYEKSEFGSTHADIGAYLLGVWGLPADIISAVSLHHDLYHIDFAEINPSISTWFADLFVDGFTDQNYREGFDLTPEMLEVNILQQHAESWKQICLDVLTI